MMSSLRSRLIFGATISLAIVFVVAAIALYLLIRMSLLTEFDASLAAEAHTLTALVEQDARGVDVELSSETLPEFQRERNGRYFEIWSADGQSIARSPSMGKSRFPHESASEGEPRFASVVLPDRQAGRAIFLTFKPRSEDLDEGVQPQTVTLAAARDTREMQRSLAMLGWLLAGVNAAAVVTGVGVMTWVIGRGLQPLNALARSIERVGTTNLADRITSADTPREMTPVVERLNELLARMEAAVGRERSFTADVSHELRTPLAGLSSVLEVTALRPREPVDYQAAMEKCLGVTRNMQSMVESLLLLARADAGQLASTGPAIDFGKLLHECLDLHACEADRRGLQVKLTMSPEVSTARTDDALLRMVLNNVLTNAVSYSDAGGQIEITANTCDGTVTLHISNTGSAVPSDAAASVFDRFWRGEAARSNAGVHCGLGLPLSRKLLESLGGTIAATSDAGTFRVTVVVPVAVSESRAHLLR